MTQTETRPQPVDQWAVAARQLGRDWAALVNAAAAGTDDAPRAAVRGMRSVVTDVLELERVCIGAWQARMPAGYAAWALPRVSLALAATALEAQARLWQAWGVAPSETASRAVVGTPAGESQWPAASRERGTAGGSGAATAAG